MLSRAAVRGLFPTIGHGVDNTSAGGERGERNDGDDQEQRASWDGTVTTLLLLRDRGAMDDGRLVDLVAQVAAQVEKGGGVFGCVCSPT